MDRFLGLFVIMALLFPSGLPRPGKVCDAVNPDVPACCCEAENNLASADEQAPRLKKPCCCDVKAPEPGKTPVPALVVSTDQEWSAPPLLAESAANYALPQTPLRLLAHAVAPRGPPGDLYRKHCVIRC